MSGGLLQRIRSRSQGRSAVGLEQAILEHVLVLLNTRQGSSALDPSYGLPDLTDLTHNVPEGVPALQRMIVEAIQRYEPRLKSVHVRPLPLAPGALTLSFEVRAQLARGGAFRFETKVCRGGQIYVT